MSEAGRYRVRALDRALVILRMLNQHDGLNASELSRLVKLPRPTVLRLLQTLSESGYVARSEADGYFRCSRKVRELSDGYQEEVWLRGVVRPFLANLADDLVWPLAVLKLYGSALIVEAATDQQSAMVVRRDYPGIEVPLLNSTAGYLYMALGPQKVHRTLLAEALKMGGEKAEVLALVEESRRCGYAVLHLPSHSAVSVPVWLNGELSCALNLRMHASPEARRVNLGHYIPPLLDAAKQLSARIGACSLSP